VGNRISRAVSLVILVAIKFRPIAIISVGSKHEQS
jgi:hypothetical protein